MTETSEIRVEQTKLDELYARLDELREETTARLGTVRISEVGGNHQHRTERDAFATLYEDQLIRLDGAEEGLCFGRLDIVDEDDPTYIGRIGLTDEQRQQILIDWRAPAAERFYQSTAANPDGIARRRHLVTANRKVTGIEDDVLDIDALDDSQRSNLQGEGALLAALTTHRTGRMGDIVATIQAEQDAIIRRPLSGVLVVQGGPGTGKTAVALHRAAYLLYTHRRRLEHTGVLIMAPTPGFLRYIERVLPSLGESGVVMMTPGEMFPGVETFSHDADDVARVKGDAAMAELLSRAVKQRQAVPEKDVRLRIDGTPLVLTRDMLRAARREARATHKPHNAARAVFVRAAMDRLVEAYERALVAQGSTIVPEDRPDLLSDLRHDPEVKRQLNLAWLPYTPQGFLRILFARPDRLRAAAPRSLAGRVDLLVRPKDSPWTVEDVPLLDEVAELLGEDAAPAEAKARDDAERRRADVEYARKVIENIDTSGIVRAEDLADQVGQIRDGRTLAERASSERSWTYGHVVVDEAQEHSPMSWRALMRRAPTKSFTVVGDVAQTSSAGGTDSWTAALSPYIQDRLQVEHLTVNYRTPRRIMDRAVAMAQAHSLPVTEVSSVRDGEEDPLLEQVSPAELTARSAEAVRRVHDRLPGRIAVIAAVERLRDLAAAIDSLESVPSVGIGSAGVDDEVAVMTAQDAKGLEFDIVVIVEPAELIDAHGAGDLYVAMSRSTQHLGVVHSRELPAGMAG